MFGVLFSIGKVAIATLTSLVVANGPKILRLATSQLLRKILSLGKAPEYRVETSSLDETKKINELIYKCVENYSEKTREFEYIAKGLFREYTNRLTNELENFVQNNLIEPYIFEILKNETKFIERKIENSYTEEINKTFSLNNNELLDILKKSPGKEKEEKLKTLAIKTLEKSHEKFILEVKELISEQQKLIERELKTLKTTQLKIENTLYRDLEELESNISDAESMKKKSQEIEFIIYKLQKIQGGY